MSAAKSNDDAFDAEPASYAAAMSEIDEILKFLEADEVDIDRLAPKVKRATFLIDYCEQRLRVAEMSLSTVLPGSDDKNAEAF